MPTDPFPACDAQFRAGASPALDVRIFNSLPRTWPLQKVTNLLLLWMQYHFGLASRIVQPQLADKVWTNSPASPILITSLADFKPTDSQKRAAILPARQTVKMHQESRGLGANRQLAGCGHGPLRRVYQKYMIGRHLIHCVGGKEGEAEVLATEVYEEISDFCPIIQEALCFVTFRCDEIGPRMQLEEHKQTYTVPVLVDYAYVRSWEITGTAATLSRVELGVTTPDLTG